MAWTAPRTWVVNEIPTAANFNTHLRDNTREIWREVAYVEFTAPVSVTTASTEASPINIVSAGAIVFDVQPILIEFYSPSMQTAGTLGINLWDGTDLGRINVVGNGAVDNRIGSLSCRRLTPTGASHTYVIRGWATVATGTVHAGAGGVGTILPGYIRILQKGV